jgi:hypothetical protein
MASAIVGRELYDDEGHAEQDHRHAQRPVRCRVQLVSLPLVELCDLLC